MVAGAQALSLIRDTARKCEGNLIQFVYRSRMCLLLYQILFHRCRASDINTKQVDSFLLVNRYSYTKWHIITIVNYMSWQRLNCLNNCISHLLDGTRFRVVSNIQYHGCMLLVYLIVAKNIISPSPHSIHIPKIKSIIT